MNFLEKCRVSSLVLGAILLKRRLPLAVTWNITYRCNLKCGYCGVHQKKIKELDTTGVISVIDELAQAGTRYLKFSGGEPLCREDLGEIIVHCRRKNIQVLLNSNGTLIKKEFQKIKDVEEIQFCLDGPPEVHDRMRGDGVHAQVLEAINMCQRHKISCGLITVLTRSSIPSIPYILQIAERYKIGVCFQPVTQDMSNGCDTEALSMLRPDPSEFREAVNFLMGEKRRGNRFIAQSMSGLKHLYRWPEPKKVNCLKRRVCAFLEPDGKVFTCNMFPDYEKYLISPEGKGYKKTFVQISLPFPCAECWSNDMELNLSGELKMDAMLSLWKRFSERT